MKVNIQDLRKLDQDLKKLEKDFKKKLDKHFNKLESDSLKQLSRYKKTGKLKLADNRQEGLNNLYKNYFADVEKVSIKHTKNELYRDFTNKEKRQKIADIKVDKRTKANLKYAEKLSNKQIKDFDKRITSSLDKLLKENKDASISELKKIVRQDTKKFKNVRSKTTASTESIRVASDIRKSIYNDLDEPQKLVIFTAVLDENTSDICESRDGTVIALNDPLISQYTPPLHPNCRSSLRYLKIEKKKTNRNTVKKQVRIEPKNENKLL